MKLTEHVPTKRLRGQRRARVPMIRVRQIVECRQVDCEDANGSDANGNSRHDPMHATKTRPPKHEQANGHARALHTGKVQASLGGIRQLAISARDFFLVDGEYGGEDTGGAHCGKHGVCLLQAEVVVGLEYEWDGGKGEV